MARTKAKLVRVDRTRDVIDEEGNVTQVIIGYDMVTQKVPFTDKEEAQRDAEEAAWAAAKPERERDQAIKAEMQVLHQEEQDDLKNRAETSLRGRGLIE